MGDSLGQIVWTGVKPIFVVTPVPAISQLFIIAQKPEKCNPRYQMSFVEYIEKTFIEAGSSVVFQESLL